MLSRNMWKNGGSENILEAYAAYSPFKQKEEKVDSSRPCTETTDV